MILKVLRPKYAKQVQVIEIINENKSKREAINYVAGEGQNLTTILILTFVCILAPMHQ